MLKLGRSHHHDLPRLTLLAAAVVLEAIVVLSAVLQTAFLPLGDAYARVISLAVFVLPTLVGLLSQRFEAAIVLAVLPFWTTVLIYVGVYAPIYNTDLVQLGALIGPVAGSSFMLGGLGLFGWLIRRASMGAKAARVTVE